MSAFNAEEIAGIQLPAPIIIGGATLYLGDCIEVMRTLPDCSVDSVVTDPPYHLTTDKRGGTGPASLNVNSPAGRARISTGFMGKSWDGGDIAQNVEMWAEVLRVLKPGGHLLAFSGTRTSHRMVCAIEDAGFEIRDSIHWIYGSGFPKSMSVSKAIDKQAGAEREVLSEGRAVKRMIPGADQDATGSWIKHSGREYMPTVTAAATPEAAQWDGWGTALKPAHEPCCMARKPLVNGLTVAANVLVHGVGAINIDGCKVEVADAAYARNCSGDRGHAGTRGANQEGATNLHAGGGSAGAGRWPANLIHDGSPEVVALFPDSTSGAMRAGTKRAAQEGPGSVCYGTYGGNIASADVPASAGSAARFFYCAKASRADRNAGLVDPGPQFQHGTTLRKVEDAPKAGNTHPTVKPTDLMAYLCRLVTPPGGLVLDPFMGSGSTGKAAIREGLSFIGIDQSAEYLPIAEARMRHEVAEVAAAALAAVEASAPAPQFNLFEEQEL